MESSGKVLRADEPENQANDLRCAQRSDLVQDVEDQGPLLWGPEPLPQDAKAVLSQLLVANGAALGPPEGERVCEGMS